MLTFSQYQELAEETAVYPRDKEWPAIYTSLGIANEGGEVAGVMKKYIRGDMTYIEFSDKMEKEIGDVLWYCAMLATELQLDLGEIAHNNLTKLADRKERGVLKGDGDVR